MRYRVFPVVLVLLALVDAGGPRAQNQSRFDEQLLRAFTYRNLGPFRMGARTSDIAVPTAPAKEHLYTFYVGFWTGGLWKTTNNGTTFEPVFDGQRKLAIWRRDRRAFERECRLGRHRRRVHVAQLVRR